VLAMALAARCPSNPARPDRKLFTRTSEVAPAFSAQGTSARALLGNDTGRRASTPATARARP
jgi:hypothetical protein